MDFFQKWAIPGNFFVFSMQIKPVDGQKEMLMAGFEPSSLLSEETALPTEPQPLPIFEIYCLKSAFYMKFSVIKFK